MISPKACGIIFIKDASMQLRYQMRDAGAEQIEVTLDQDIKMAEIESREVFVEALVTATAGSSRVAH